MRNVIIAAAGSLVLAGCVPAAVPGAGMPPVPSLARQQDNPRLALLEHVLTAYFNSDITNRPTVCASANDGREEAALEPAEEVALLERFEQLAPMARCTLAGGGWRDAESEQPALVYTLQSFTCASAESCTGWAGYRAGSSAFVRYLYAMDWRDGRWQIARDGRAAAQ